MTKPTIPGCVASCGTEPGRIRSRRQQLRQRRVVQYIGDIAPSDPAFTERLYLLVFSTEVRSEEKTLMGGGPVFSMTSTRRQDFQLCQYLLLEYFRVYLK